MTARLVLRGGLVWTGRGRPPARALAAGDGRVMALDAEAEAAIGPATRVVELDGRLAVPGFNDAHVHFLEGGLALLSVDLRAATDEDDLARRLGERARSLPAGAWITGGQWDHHAWPSGGLPSRAAADAATPAHPVFVRRLDGHMALANSLALQAAGITRETQDPVGGTIERDARGQPTGILKDEAMGLVRRAMPPRSPARMRLAVQAAMAEAARLGVTTVQDNSPVESLAVYQELHDEGALTVRLCAWRPIEVLDALIAAGARPGLGDEWLRLGALKLLADGSLGAGTAAFREGYADEPANRGLLLKPAEEIERLILRADAHRFQLAVHAIGDRANTLVLDCFERARRANPPWDRRWRIEHAQHVAPGDLARFRDLGVIASLQPFHAMDDMRWAERRLGQARLAEAYRLRSFLDAGVEVAFGTDWYVEPLDPRTVLHAAVRRQDAQGRPPDGWRPGERVSLEQALDAYTRGAAVAERAERDKGTLAPGRLADVVVLSRNILEDEAAVLQAEVDLTVVGGRVVYER
ncbi:MAG TPA: amidohydrolase [Vicinamibacteria bacterium]|nr:amidohydrolase [Vicinamibacteria bacterium]